MMKMNEIEKLTANDFGEGNTQRDFQLPLVAELIGREKPAIPPAGERPMENTGNVCDKILNMELGILARGGELPAQVRQHFRWLIEQGHLVPTRRA